jgi:CRISPR-associated endoribonuclease Cas6
MRLLIRLRSLQNGPYEMQYHYHLQGFIYSLLKGSKYHHVHDKGGYKFFCFSNIFPANPLRKDDLRTLIISSPDAEFISYLYEVLIKRSAAEVQVGSMRFGIDSLDKIDVKIPDSHFSLITGTPIIIRVPRQKYRDFGFEPKGQYDYVYWRSDHPIQLFISQVEDNIMKKYAEYHGLYNPAAKHRDGQYPVRPDTSFLFQKFKFKKQVSTRVLMKGLEQVVIGTVWEFMFEGWENRDLVRFAVDCGLGERNSLGFGFMNIC